MNFPEWCAQAHQDRYENLNTQTFIASSGSVSPYRDMYYQFARPYLRLIEDVVLDTPIFPPTDDLVEVIQFLGAQYGRDNVTWTQPLAAVWAQYLIDTGRSKSLRANWVNHLAWEIDCLITEKVILNGTWVGGRDVHAYEVHRIHFGETERRHCYAEGCEEHPYSEPMVSEADHLAAMEELREELS